MAQPDRHRYGLLIVEDQGRHVRAGRETVSAVPPRRGIDRISEVAESVEIAAHGSFRDVEPRSQLGARPEAMGLQKRQQLQCSPGGIGSHVSSLPTI